MDSILYHARWKEEDTRTIASRPRKALYILRAPFSFKLEKHHAGWLRSQQVQT